MKINKNIVKHVSSGGFIFHKDKKNLKISVLLIKNTKDEWWIPKGKLETDESQLDAAFREIKEEVGFDFNQLKHVGFCDTFTYGYDLDNDNYLVKDLFVNVFECDEKYEPTPTDWNDLTALEWMDYEDALNKISFTKDLLIKAYEKFITSSGKVNSLYSIAISQIRGSLEKLDCKDNLISIVLYGSIFKKIFEIDVHDTDLIIVVNDTTKDLAQLFELLRNTFNKLDFHIYTKTEIESDVSFYSREYVLEYLAKGVSLYGDNPFIEKFKKVTENQYQNSILIRSIAHTQMVRQVYLSNKHSYEHKVKYLKKYIQRLGKNMLLMLNKFDYETLDKISTDLLLRELVNNDLIKNVSIEGFNELKPIEFYYYIFSSLSDNLPTLKKQLASDLSKEI